MMAILQHFQERHPQVRLAADLSFGSWQERAAYGLATKLKIGRWGRSRIALHLMPASFRQALGVVREAEVDAVLDAAGFAFGDQHPLERILRFAKQAERWTVLGKPVILLPQALGPFEKPGYAAAFGQLAAAATLVFARDAASLQHARQACGEQSKLRLAPDFTNLLKPGLTALSAESCRVCVVPNQRMLEQAANEAGRDSYIDFLLHSIEQVRERDFEPVALLHDADDRHLVERLNDRLTDKLPITDLRDPLAIKRFIGESHLVIGSRFHALVSALAQGVPALATSWSHKYEALFADYGQADCVLPADVSRDDLGAHIVRLLGKGRAPVVAAIRERAADQERSVRAMWGEVEVALGLPSSQLMGADAT